MQAPALIESLFAQKPETDRILVWTMPGKQSTWYASHTELGVPNHNTNVYFGVGTVSAETAAACGKYKRSTIATVTGIPALWLDVDIAGPGHKKGNLPADTEAALVLVGKAFPDLQPSHIINSGHGLQIYWTLSEWLAITDDNRAAVSETLLQFNTRWRDVCKAEGHDADSVCDLARVMRLPGSMNVKIADAPISVTSILATDITHRFEDIAKWLKENAAPPMSIQSTLPKTVSKKTKPIDIDPDKWEALCENEPRAQLSFDHTRMDIGDQSPSSYDMSLLAFAIRAGWTDAEAVALCVACRRKHGLEIKTHALRHTLGKVKAEQAALLAGSPGVEPVTATDDNAAKLKKLGDGLGLPILSITRYDSTPPAYVLITPDMRIPLGVIDSITDQKKFRNTIAAAIGILPIKFKPDPWDAAVRMMLTCLDHDSAGPEATEDGQIYEWLSSYLSRVTIHTGYSDADNREAGLTSGEPWTEAGTVHITGTPLRSWLSVQLSERVDSRRLGLLLKSTGSEPCTVQFKASGDDTTRKRAAWRISKGVWTPK